MTISGKTRIIGVWGYPVEHSLSPAMHNAALSALGIDWVYVPFSIEPGKIVNAVEAIRALDLIGVNVTVPHKESIAPLLDHIDPPAARINSVNTIVNTSGKLYGYSTDGPGLLWDLKDKEALPKAGSTVLVLGAGGSARAVVDSLHGAGFSIVMANRTQSRAERLVSDLDVPAKVVGWSAQELTLAAKSARLIINTTTLGMTSGNAEDIDVFSSGAICADTIVYDLVYTPAETPLMNIARGCGAESFNGSGMLVRQGALSLSLWTGIKLTEIPIEVMQLAINKKLKAIET